MLGIFVAPLAFSDETANLSIPVGSLSAYPTVVRTGAKPTLTWSINYPSVVQDYITITHPGKITPKVKLIADVRVIGAGVTSPSSNGSINYIETVCQMSLNGNSNWVTIFDGDNTDSVVQQQSIIKTVSLTQNKSLEFGGKYYYSNTWSPFYSTLSGDNVRTLVNGETPPSVLPSAGEPGLESFLKPYLDASGKVKIGPMDIIVLMELTHSSSQKSNPGYDLQDLVLLVSFRTPSDHD